MSVVPLLKDLADRLESIENGDTKEAKSLLNWASTGELSVLTENIWALLQEKAATVASKPTVLAGAISFTIQNSELYDKTVVIIGEHHLLEASSCGTGDGIVTVSNLLKQIFQEATAPVDFYIESTYQRGDGPRKGEWGSGGSELAKADTIFASCLTREKKECLFPMVRMHYADIRSASASDKLNWSLRRLIYNRLPSGRPNLNLVAATLQLLKDNDEYKQHFVDEKSLQEWAGADFIRTRIDKQLAAVPDIKVRDAIRAFGAQLRQEAITAKSMDQLRLLRRIVTQIVRYLLPLGDADIDVEAAKRLADALRVAYQTLFLMGIAYMDEYLLARVFRTFRQVEGRISTPPKHIILFTGNSHSNNYRRFLTSLGFTTIYTAKAMSKRECLDISDLKFPLW
ncbi:Hypothetical protein POVN_LOCUS687 [uncultured virus]|nr:Hypothetical protein POVN_LOCUS687 [uncultured virus]